MMNSKDPATLRQSGVNCNSLVPFAAQIDLLKEKAEERDHPGPGGTKEEGKAGRMESRNLGLGEGISPPHHKTPCLGKGWTVLLLKLLESGLTNLPSASGTHDPCAFLPQKQKQDSILEGFPWVKLEALQTGTPQCPSQGTSRPTDWKKKGGRVTLGNKGCVLVSTHPLSSAL